MIVCTFQINGYDCFRKVNDWLKYVVHIQK